MFEDTLMTTTDVSLVKLLNFMHKKGNMDIQTKKASHKQVRKYEY